MAASPSSQNPQSVSLSAAQQPSSGPDSNASAVISVSAHKAVHDGGHIIAADDQCVANSLAALIKESEKVAISLDELNAHGRENAAKSAKSSLHLQERLRLSARMLKAFSAQISRVEAAIAQLHGREESLQNLQTQAEKRFAGLAAERETALSEFRQVLSAAAAAALELFNDQLAQKVELHAREMAAADPVAKVTQEVRQRINQDMNWLSKAMRDVAQRVEELAGLSDEASSRTGAVAPPASIEPKPDRSPVQSESTPPLRLRTWVGGA